MLYSPAKRSSKTLANRYDIIISKADEDGAKVIQDIDIYKQGATQELEDNNIYKKSRINPTLEYNTKINSHR